MTRNEAQILIAAWGRFQYDFSIRDEAAIRRLSPVEFADFDDLEGSDLQYGRLGDLISGKEEDAQ